MMSVCVMKSSKHMEDEVTRSAAKFTPHVKAHVRHMT